MLESFSSRDRAALETEARRAGVAIVSSERFDLETQALGQRVGQLAKLAIVGEAKLTVTHIEVVQLDGPAGPSIYLVPFQGGTSLVGVHHHRAEGGLPVAAIFRKGLLGGKWQAEDPATEQRLKATKPLAAALKDLPFAKQTGLGAIDLAWTVQLSALGDDTTHIAIQAGSRHTDVNYQCVGAAVAVTLALVPLFTEKSARQGWYVEPPYLPLVYGKK